MSDYVIYDGNIVSCTPGVIADLGLRAGQHVSLETLWRIFEANSGAMQFPAIPADPESHTAPHT